MEALFRRSFGRRDGGDCTPCLDVARPAAIAPAPRDRLGSRANSLTYVVGLCAGLGLLFERLVGGVGAGSSMDSSPGWVRSFSWGSMCFESVQGRPQPGNEKRRRNDAGVVLTGLNDFVNLLNGIGPSGRSILMYSIWGPDPDGTARFITAYPRNP